MIIEKLTRLSRKQQAEANQQRLLDAALEVFTARGFHGASLEQIAAAAGFTTGVVYSRFGSKADLFLALLERTIEQRIADLRRLGRTEVGEVGVAIARAWWGRVRKQPEWMLVVMEFRVHAARDPQGAYYADTLRANRFILIGYSRRERLPYVVHAEVRIETIRIISARKATRREKTH